MRNLFILPLFVFFSQPSFCQNTLLSGYVSKLITDPTLQNVSWAIKVENISSSKTVIEYNSKLSLIPASLLKIVTTGVAYQTLGQNFRFKTLLAHDGTISDGVLKGNLYIIGGGDPFLGSYRYKQTVPDSVFAKWHAALVAKNISTIDGNVYYDATLFDDAQIPDSWQWEDMGNYYGCGTSALSFHENMYHIYFKPAAQKGGEAKILYTKPTIPSLTFDNKVTTGAPKSGDNVIIYGAPGSNIHFLRGTIPQDEPEFNVRGAMPNPPKVCAEFFIKYLQQRRMNIPSTPLCVSANSKSTKEARSILFEYNSYPLSQVITQTNLQSNNMYAECIFKYLGSLKGKKGSYEEGRDAIYSFLESKSISSNDINIADGSGLSRQNLLTADFLCSFLAFMKNNDTGDIFYNSLSKSTQASAINQGLNKTNIQNTLRYKTGSMKNVRSYAGYVKNMDGEWLCFSIIINNFNVSDSEIRSKFEKLFQYIATSK